MFPDIEVVLMDLLTRFVAGPANTGTVTPADLKKRLPFIRVNRYGGRDDNVTDYPSVDIDVFATDRMTAWRTANQIRDFLLATPHKINNSVIDHVDTIVGPTARPADDSTVQRFSGTYQVTGRRTHS